MIDLALLPLCASVDLRFTTVVAIFIVAFPKHLGRSLDAGTLQLDDKGCRVHRSSLRQRFSRQVLMLFQHLQFLRQARMVVNPKTTKEMKKTNVAKTKTRRNVQMNILRGSRDSQREV